MSAAIQPTPQTFRLPAELGQMAALGERIRAWTTQCAPGDAEVASRLELAVHEIATNIVRHAYRSDESGSFEVELRGSATELVVTLRDSGDAFDPTTVPMPDPAEPQVGGYGLYLVERLADDVRYRRTSTGNEWRLTCRHVHP